MYGLGVDDLHHYHAQGAKMSNFPSLTNFLTNSPRKSSVAVLGGMEVKYSSFPVSIRKGSVSTKVHLTPDGLDSYTVPHYESMGS
jgi:hypothetical protein